MVFWLNPFILKIGYLWVGKTLGLIKSEMFVCFFFKKNVILRLEL